MARTRRLALPLAGRSASLLWADHSRLFIREDGAGWSLSEDARTLARVAKQLGIRVAPAGLADHVRRQSHFFTSHFELLGGDSLLGGNRVATAYFHGRPGTAAMPEFDRAYAGLRRNALQISRLQVTHEEMRNLVLTAGVPVERVFLIRIPVDLARFRAPTAEERLRMRAELGLPAAAFAVGSLQKDGVGWKDGLEPKLIKGPDVLLEALDRLRSDVPELHVVLTGPARGFVRRGLERLGIPYVHRVFDDQASVASVFHALDACVVSSRQEGGPKAALEAMASGVPLVTTRVGQAGELVEHGVNGFVAEVGDAEALAEGMRRVHAAPAARIAELRARGLATAAENSVEAQVELWRRFFTGFVRCAG